MYGQQMAKVNVGIFFILVYLYFLKLDIVNRNVVSYFDINLINIIKYSAELIIK